MKKNLFLICLLIFSNTFSQTLLEKDVKGMNITFNIPKSFQFSNNTTSVYPAEIAEKNPLPSLAQVYGTEIAPNDVFMNSLWGMITSVAYNKDKDYYVFIKTFQSSNDRNGVSVKTLASCLSSQEILWLETLPFDSIKQKFRYGIPFTGATEYEAYELYQMLHFFDKKEAKNFFNGEIMFSFPVNLKGQKYKEKYAHSKAVVLQKGGKIIYLYFMMTNDNFCNFNTFLNDFNKVFWFNN